MENKIKNKALAASERRQSLRYGGWLAILGAAALVLCIALNLLASALPTTLTQPDLSLGGLYTLSDTSKQLAAGLQQDVTVYFLAETGEEDPGIARLLEVYADTGSRIKVVRKDPVLNPAFAAQYTDETVYPGSCILVNEQTGRSRFVSYYDLYIPDYSDYYYGGEVTWTFGAEGALTSALDYVTSDRLPTVYRTTGHGELELDEGMTAALEGDNMTLAAQAVDLLTGEIPADCDALLLYAPARDLGSGEADTLLTWLQNGGQLMVVTDYLQEAQLPNLLRVMEACGLALEPGLVLEGQSGSYMRGYPHYILPDIEETAMTGPLYESGLRVLAPMVQALTLSDAYEEGGSLTVTPLLTTSGYAYIKKDPQNAATLEQQEGDLSGSFTVAAAAEWGDSKLVWFTGSTMFYQDIDSYVSGANSDLILGCFGWLTGHESSISVHAKSLDQAMLTVPQSDADRLSLGAVVLLPLGCLVLGGAVCIKRRRMA